ncbi:MAG: hypothetical protein J5776_02485 [Clostridiales bacterium]|nr:hypothetical protein [Clostridiales bacterium]
MAKKKIASKIAASSLILSMILAATGCNGASVPGLPGSATKKQATVVEESTIWYDASSTIVDPGVDPSKDLDWVSTYLVGILDGKLILRTYGNYKLPDDFDWEKDDYSEYSIDKLVSYDIDSESTENLFDLNGLNKSEGDIYTGVNDIQIVDGKLVVSLYEYNNKTWEETQSEFTIDPSTGASTDPEPVESDDFDGSKYLEMSIKIGDTTVNYYYIYDPNTGESSYEAYTVDASGKETKLDFKVEGEVYGVSFMFPVSDTEAVGKVWTNGSDKYVITDIEAGTVEEADEKEFEWLDEVGYISNGLVGEDGKIYSAASDGIYSIDFKEEKAEKALDFGNVGISRSQLEYMELVSFGEDQVVLAGAAYSYTMYSNDWSDKYQIITLTKADKNPNAGKTILELYCLGGYADDTIYDAITEYNNEDKDYFIMMTDDYDVNKYYDDDYSDFESDDDWSQLELDAMAGLSDELAVDLINGEGPDIILNAAMLGQLNNDNYLADLSGYVKELDSDEYFMNIIDASYTGEKLYQLPITYYINGIQTSSDNAGASGVGFTLDEYVDFVDDACNGTDPITSGQNMYFIKLFNESSADFIKDGKADFSGEEFAALAEYCYDNVPEKAQSYDDMYDDYGVGYYYEAPSYAAMDVTCYSLGTYLDNITYIEGGGDAILGYPSVDGKGPSASPAYSAAISASAVDVDACWDFIKTLISEDIQTEMAQAGNNVINKPAFESITDMAIDYYNDMYADDYYYGVGVGAPSKPDKFSNDDADNFKDIVESITVMNTSDASISKIISEEMPAYFSGQKGLDDVLEILQDRVQKVLDERG